MVAILGVADPGTACLLGDNGGGEPFGIRLAEARAAPLAVQTGEVFEDACLAVVGLDLAGVLTRQTAYHLLLSDRTDPTRA